MRKPRRAFVTVLAAVIAGLAFSPSAQATFPGANRRIAFVRGADIYTMQPDGHGVRRLTTHGDGVGAFFESWSPDGRQIVFTKYFPDIPAQLWVMAADGKRAASVARRARLREPSTALLAGRQVDRLRALPREPVRALRDLAYEGRRHEPQGGCPDDDNCVNPGWGVMP